ncbi:MAG: FadR/GntR family transcriptional regulator [Pseudoclavibacter sp.]
MPRRIADAIGQLIDSGRIAEGDALPSERWLATRLQVSRSSLRKALALLVERGEIRSHPRSRWEVAPTRRRLPEVHHMLAAPFSAPQTLRTVMDFRLSIEPAIAARAAHRRRPDELADVERPLLEAEREVERLRPRAERLQQLDVEFHARIATASHNPLLTRLLRETQEWMTPTRTRSMQSPERSRTSVRGHRALFTAISLGQAEEAHRAMTQHLQEVLEVITPLANPLELLE